MLTDYLIDIYYYLFFDFLIYSANKSPWILFSVLIINLVYVQITIIITVAGQSGYAKAILVSVLGISIAWALLNILCIVWCTEYYHNVYLEAFKSSLMFILCLACIIDAIIKDSGIVNIPHISKLSTLRYYLAIYIMSTLCTLYIDYYWLYVIAGQDITLIM